VLIPPLISPITRNGANTQLSFPTIPGPNYTVEYNSEVLPTNWTILGTWPGTGDLLTVSDVQPSRHRIYRLRVQ
jgi:hypothetical protein